MIDPKKIEELADEIGNLFYGLTRDQVAKIEAFILTREAAIREKAREVLENLKHASDGRLPRGEYQRGVDACMDKVSDAIDEAKKIFE